MKHLPNHAAFATNPASIAAFYFAVFVLAFNLLAKYFLFVFNVRALMPIYSSSLLALFLGGLLGYLFGPRLAKHHSARHIFTLGMLLAITLLPLYSLGMQYILYLHHDVIYTHLHLWTDYAVLYGVILLFILLVAGIWFIPFTGLAALLFNRRFLPGYYAYLQKND